VKIQRGLAIGLAALAVGLLLTPSIWAEAKNVELKQKWSASIDDEALKKEMPKNGVITNAKQFEKLWKAWKIGDKMPKIDFRKNLVIVTTTVGSKLNLSARLDDKGDLKILGLATRDLRPGFRYVAGVISREGVKTVDGKELKNK
jgi:hypothetical protein